MKTHYEVLGLLPQADDVVIKAAHKALAQKFHPDKHKTNKAHYTEVMARINAAYEILGDKEQRSKYDHLLAQRALRKAKTDKTKEEKAKPEAKSRAEPAQADKPKNAKSSSRHKVHADLVERLRHNAIDEFSTVKLYEETFQCTITINNGWINTYTVKGKTDRQVLDFARLKAKLLNHFSEEEA